MGPRVESCARATQWQPPPRLRKVPRTEEHAGAWASADRDTQSPANRLEPVLRRASKANNSEDLEFARTIKCETPATEQKPTRTSEPLVSGSSPERAGRATIDRIAP